jgi:molybdopterin-guanine dinucleotide biosynthesis protein
VLTSATPAEIDWVLVEGFAEAGRAFAARHRGATRRTMKQIMVPTGKVNPAAR